MRCLLGSVGGLGMFLGNIWAPVAVFGYLGGGLILPAKDVTGSLEFARCRPGLLSFSCACKLRYPQLRQKVIY